LRIPLAECLPSNNDSYSLFNSPTLFVREGPHSATYPKSQFSFDRSVDGIDSIQKENTNAGPAPLQERGIFAKSQISKCNSSHILQQTSQQQKKPSLYQKLQSERVNKENAMSETLSIDANRENLKGSKGLQNKGQSKQPTLRVVNPNLMHSKFGNSSGNWNSTVDSNPPSAKSFYSSKIESMLQEESFEISTPELTRECSSPFFSDNTPTLSNKSPNESFGGNSRRAGMEMPGHDIRRLKRDCQLSPRTKTYFDDIERKRKEVNGKSTITEILTFYLNLLPEVQSKYHWKLFLDVAEACKKECSYKYAKFFYKAAISLQPYNADIWLEYAKLEEDYGNLNKVKEILKQAMAYNNLNENLVIKFLRVEEKFGRIEESRKILSKLKNQNIEKIWKLYLEGAQLEGKCGNPKSAKRVFKMLLKNLDMQGNVYLEYAKFEENTGNVMGAVKICYEGISRNLRFSNLWAYALRLCEKISGGMNSIPVDRYLSLAMDCLPRDMLWKIYLEIAGIAERKNNINKSKNYITKAIMGCPENVKWKCFVLGARLELKDNYPAKAKKLVNHYLQTQNEKQKYHLLIESSKIAEFQGDIPSTMMYFEHTRDYMRAEWKAYLEYIHMLIRNHQYEQALTVASESLYYHNLAGRLWASMIQLKHITGKDSPGTDAYKSFMIAVNEVPKSGEVWCEGARVCLNPLSDRFNIEKAKRFLNFAIYFTPQYGDSFIEAMRLYLLLGDRKEFANLKKKIINAQPNYGNVWQFLKKNTGESVHETWKNAKKVVKADLLRDAHLYRARMCNVTGENGPMANCDSQILSACSDYNMILQGKKEASVQEKLKLIFHTDQSLL